MANLNQVSPHSPRGENGEGGKKKGKWPFPEPDYGEGFKYDPDFNGPTRNHSCTDVICLGIFGAFLGAWAFVGYFAYTQGDINKVIYPTDSHGQICGMGNMGDRPYLLFFDLTRCLNPAVLSLGCPTPQVCVHECPKDQYSGYAAAYASSLGDSMIKRRMKPYCLHVPDSEWDRTSAMDLLKKEICPSWWLPSNPVLGRCLPLVVSSNEEESNPNKTVFGEGQTMDGKPVSEGTISSAVTALGAFLQLRGLGERVFNDLSDTWWMIGVAMVAACIISFLWIILMRFFAGIMVWVSLGGICLLFGGLFGWTLYKYIKIKDLPTAQGNIFQVNFTPDYGKDLLALAETWLAFAIMLGIVFGIVVLVLIALRQRIAIAIELIEEGSKAVGHMFTTLFWPVFPFVLHIVVAFFFTAVALYLSSAGEAEYKIAFPNADSEVLAEAVRSNFRSAPTASTLKSCGKECINPTSNVTYRVGETCIPGEFNKTCADCPEVQCQFTKYVKAQDASWMQWYNLFGLYWGMFFASALSEMVLAGAFARWYWTFDKGDVPCCILAVSFSNAVFYHLGTVAFGSFIIAVIRMIRTIVSYVESKLKLYNNDLTRCLICLCKCCLWCLEKFMRFINRNAYIMCAIKNTNFCSSAKDAFSLLMRNILRVMVLNNVVAFLLFLGQVVIVVGVGCLAYFVFSGDIPGVKDDIPTLNYFFTPIVVIVIGSWFIAHSFFGVYAMAVDTIFLCFLEDMERNDGTPARPYYMSRGLQKVVGKMQKFNDGRD